MVFFRRGVKGVLSMINAAGDPVNDAWPLWPALASILLPQTSSEPPLRSVGPCPAERRSDAAGLKGLPRLFCPTEFPGLSIYF